MTAEERDRIDRVAEGMSIVRDEVSGLREELHVFIAENRAAWEGFKKVCEERHGSNAWSRRQSTIAIVALVIALASAIAAVLLNLA